MPSLTKNPDGSPHIHQYVRATKADLTKDPNKYRCNHPRCTHFEYKQNLLNKLALCGVCGQKEIILTAAMLRLARPACLHCTKSKKAAARKEKMHLLEDMFGEIGGAPQI